MLQSAGHQGAWRLVEMLAFYMGISCGLLPILVQLSIYGHQGLRDSLLLVPPILWASLQGFAQSCQWQRCLQTLFLEGVCCLLMQGTCTWIFNQKANGLYGGPLFHSRCKSDTRNGTGWSFSFFVKQTRVNWAFLYKKYCFFHTMMSSLSHILNSARMTY